jgi:cytoskeletal protein CcmA (bactofilin family)
MTVEIANTELNHSFNTWRLNTNFAATVISNNAVTVWREGSANRGGLATGNGHVYGTFSANSLRTPLLKGGNTINSRGLVIASNTSINATSIMLSGNTEIGHGNVIIDISGSEVFHQGDVSRIRITGSSEKEVMFSRGNDSFTFRRITLKDLSDLSSNSSNIILSAANSTFSDNGDSPKLRFAGAAGLTDKVDIFLAADATNGDSDLYVKLVDNVGDSAFVIADAANNRVAYITSDGNLFAADVQVNALTANGNILPGTDDTYDLGSSSNQWNDLYIDGVANIDELSVSTTAGEGVATSLIPKTDATSDLGSASYKWNTLYAEAITLDGNATIAGDLSVDGTSALNGATVTTLTANGTATFNGDVVLGDASTDTITVKGNFANVSVDGAAVFNGTTTFNNTMYINGNVVMGDQITDTFTALANTDLQGNVKLGNASADEITILGQVDSNIIPVVDNGTGHYNLGGNNDRWHGMYANNVYANNIYTDNDIEVAGDLTVAGNINLNTGAAIAAPDGLFSNELTVTGTTNLNGTTNLGNATGDNINVIGSINSDIIPVALEQHNLGSTSSKWQQIYANNVTVGVDVSIGRDLTVADNLTVTNAVDFNGALDVSGKISNDGTELFSAAGVLNVTNTIDNDAITNDMLANPSISVEVTDGATVLADDTKNLGDGIQLDSGEGLSWTSAANGAYVISGENASTSNKGIASFSSDNFSLSSGAVSIKDGGIASAELADTGVTAGQFGSATSVPVITVNAKGQITARSTATVAGVNGLTYTQSNNNIRVSTATGTTYDDVIHPATTTSGTGRGVASFDSGDFSLSSGHVSLKNATTGAVLAINGTTNEVNVSRTNGTVTVGLPDDVTIAGQLNVGENIVVTGNLTVQGTTTTLNTETINLADNLIILNSDKTSAPTNGETGGIEIERGSGTNVQLRWNETSDRWEFTNNGSNFYNIPISTEYDKYTSWTIRDGDSSTYTITSGDTLQIAEGTNIDSNFTADDVLTISHKTPTGATAGAKGSSGVASITTDSQGHVTAVTTATYDNYDSWTAKSTDTSETITVSSTNTVEWSGNNGITTNVVNGDQIDIKLDSDLRGHAWQIGRDNNDSYVINTTNHSWYLDGVLDMRLENDGDLHVDGDVIADSTVTSSDIKLKENVEMVEDALNKVLSLKGVEFNWKKDGSRGAGVIAQDVEQVLPQAVKETTDMNTGEEYKTVNYDSLHALLIESIRELKAEIDELKKNK